MGVICAFAAVSCVNNAYDLDNLSKEVTIGGNPTIVPLGYLDNKTIAELLGDQVIEGFEIDENGNLLFSYAGENSSVEMDSIASSFEIPVVDNPIKANYPNFDIKMNGVIMEDARDVAVSGLDNYKVVGGDDADHNIPADGQRHVFSGTAHNLLDGDNLHLSFTVPEQVNKVTEVLFLDLEDGHYGAPMHIVMNLNDLASINNGGEMEVSIKMTGGDFRMLDANNKEVCLGTDYVATCPIVAGAESVDFAIYFESILIDEELDEDRRLDVPLTLEYDVKFSIDAKAGDFRYEQQPSVDLYADFEYCDAMVDTNPAVKLIECQVEDGNPIEIKGLPEQLKRVNKVDIEQNDKAKLCLFVHGMEWMEENGDFVDVEITLPEFLVLHKIAGEDYTLDTNTNVLKASITRLEEGVYVGVDAMDFGEEGKIPDENGDMELLFEPYVVAHFMEGANLSAESLEHDSDLGLNVNIAQASMDIESVDGLIDYSYEVKEGFELPSFAAMNLEIVHLGVKPVIEVKIIHPLTMEAVLDGAISPSLGGKVVEDNVASFGPVPLPLATSEDGEVNPVEVILIIADESLREEYTDPKYTFVPCEVGKLMNGAIPEQLDIAFEIAVDPTEMQTIVMSDSLEITYDYKVNLPFVIDDNLEVYYRGAASGLNSLFSMLAGFNIKVGDVALIATVVNTTPLELGAQVILKDINGNETVAQVRVEDATVVKGSPDGVTPAESVLRLVLDLGEDGKVTNVGEVDVLQLELAATSAVEESAVPLKDDQYIGVKLQLELAGGITIDFNQLNQ